MTLFCKSRWDFKPKNSLLMSSSFDDIVYFCETGIPSFCNRFSLKSKSCFSFSISACVFGSGVAVGANVGLGAEAVVTTGLVVVVVEAGGGTVVLEPPNSEDIKLLGAGAGAEAAVALFGTAAGVVFVDKGTVALVETLIDGVN